MRVEWSDEALADLEEIAERAPRAALLVHERIVWLGELAEHGFANLFRRYAQTDRRVVSVPPYVVIYRVRGDVLAIVRIADARRRNLPR